MVVLKIFNVDSQNNETPLAILKNGEHTLGRGYFPNCTSKIISRKHAVIKIQEDEVSLTSIHVNPCFYVSRTSPRVQILIKDRPATLEDGDKFAFLTDSWYLIKIIRDESETENLNGTSLSNVPVSEAPSEATISSPSSHTQVSHTTSTLKRSLEDLNNTGDRKKLKPINDSLDQLIENINEIQRQDFSNQDKEENKEDSSKENETVEVFKKKDVSDSSDGDSDVDMPPEVTVDSTVVTTNIEKSLSESDDKEDAKSNSSEDVEKDDEKKDDDSGSSDAMVDVKKEPMVELSESPKSDEGPSKSTVRVGHVADSDDNDNEDTKPSDSNVNYPNSDESKEGGSKQDGGNASESNSGHSMDKKLKREQCWYGGNCYRYNPNHRQEFSHPGDHDFDSDQNDDDKPECAYGAQCYRTNRVHRQQYKHPPGRPAPKPDTNKRKRRAAAPRIQTSEENSSDDDEEEDPYTADSDTSENYDEDDSDSDYSGSQKLGEESKEVQLMYREAKKFLRKKRKD